MDEDDGVEFVGIVVAERGVVGASGVSLYLTDLLLAATLPTTREPYYRYSYYYSNSTMSGYGEPTWLSQEANANTTVTQDANTGGNVTAPSPA
jgi:hypothetical protein